MDTRNRTEYPDWLVLLVAFAVVATIIGIALVVPGIVQTWR